jgi:hypothetical protein
MTDTLAPLIEYDCYFTTVTLAEQGERFWTLVEAHRVRD